MKKRPISHLVDAVGVALLESTLPREWVIREYRPDYGIDFDVEVFDYTDAGELVSLGEHFFVQLKSRSRVATIKRNVFPRFNVEKQALKVNPEDSKAIEVIPIQLDVADLQLARSMSPALPVLLIVCDVDRKLLHFLCLNDLVDKVVLPGDPDFGSKNSITIDVPTWNRVSSSVEDLIPLRFFARRAKLYAAFNRFRYQTRELPDLVPWFTMLPLESFRNSDALATIMHFLQIVKSYDFWQDTHAWPAVELAWLKVQKLDADLQRFRSGESARSIFGFSLEARLEGLAADHEIQDVFSSALLSSIRDTWNILDNLGDMFEEICREWFLATHLGALAEEYAIRSLGGDS